MRDVQPYRLLMCLQVNLLNLSLRRRRNREVITVDATISLLDSLDLNKYRLFQKGY